MWIAVRAVVMLAAVMPVFAATAFRPLWWQILIAAAIGSVLGRVADRATRGKRAATWAVMVVAAIIVAASAAWLLTRGGRHDAASGARYIVVRSADRRPSLTWDDVHALSTVPSVALAVPYLQKSMQLTSEDQNWSTRVIGTTPDYFALQGLHAAGGHLFDASETEKVVVLGDTTAKQLFGAGKVPIGETLRIDARPFTVVGVLAHLGLTSEGLDRDDIAILPLDVYLSKIDRGPSARFTGTVMISAKAPGDIERTSVEVGALLRDRHHLALGDDDDFVVRVTPAVQ